MCLLRIHLQQQANTEALRRVAMIGRAASERAGLGKGSTGNVTATPEAEVQVHTRVGHT